MPHPLDSSQNSVEQNINLTKPMLSGHIEFAVVAHFFIFYYDDEDVNAMVLKISQIILSKSLKVALIRMMIMVLMMKMMMIRSRS